MTIIAEMESSFCEILGEDVNSGSLQTERQIFTPHQRDCVNVFHPSEAQETRA